MSKIRISKVSTSGLGITDSSQQVLAENNKRAYLLLQNHSEENKIYINFDKPATVDRESLIIGAGENCLVDIEVMSSEITAICDSGLTADLFILESEAPFWG